MKNFVLILEVFSPKYSGQKGCPAYENFNIIKKKKNFVCDNEIKTEIKHTQKKSFCPG